MAGLLLNCFFVGLGGFAGSVLRYLLGLLSSSDQGGFPFVTLFINVSGAFLIGFLAAYFARNATLDEHVMLFFRIGLCGGYTTFSAFSLEAFRMLQRGDAAMTLLYAILSVVVCIVAVFIGQYCAEWIHDRAS